jgi:RimJ/RimL family protein N-acetyltransferase
MPRCQLLVSPQPTITTDRLVLRPLTIEDAPVVRALAGDRVVADTTLNIPHPYPEGEASRWISTHEEDFRARRGVTFAITRQSTGELIGAIALVIHLAHRRAEMGYWIGQAFWRRGYATEAARAVRDHGFESLPIDRIDAHHFARNPASGRVLEKIGMRREGVLRHHVVRWDRPEDLVCYGILRAEHEEKSSKRMDGVAITVPRIETRRLVLRQLEPADAEALAAVCNDEEIARGVDDVDLPYTPDKALACIERGNARAREGRCVDFAIILKESGRLIGDTVLWQIDRMHRRADLGVIIAREQWGQGYGTEVLRAVIDFAFKVLDLHRVDGGCLSWNAASARMMEKCGLVREGVRRQREWRGDHFEDETVFGLLREEWRERAVGS